MKGIRPQLGGEGLDRKNNTFHAATMLLPGKD